MTLSFQGIDLELFGLQPEDIRGDNVELLGSTYAHMLLSLYAGHKTYKAHARWQAKSGVSPISGMFLSEFDVPSKDVLPEGDYVLPVLATPNTVLYSECATGDIVPHGAVSEFEALRYRGKTVVPMVEVGAFQKAFFTWQRFPDQEHLSVLLGEIRSLAEDGRDRYLVLFIDLEAPIVGSHHALMIWKMFFAAIQDADLDSAFVHFHEAARHWKKVAQKIDQPVGSMIARNLGVKWLQFAPQLEVLDRIKAARAPKTESEHVWASFFTTSDVLSALERKLHAKDKPINLPADEGPINIGHDQTIIEIALATLKAWEDETSPVKALRELNLSDPDGQWFANRCADLLENHKL